MPVKCPLDVSQMTHFLIWEIECIKCMELLTVVILPILVVSLYEIRTRITPEF